MYKAFQKGSLAPVKASALGLAGANTDGVGVSHKHPAGECRRRLVSGEGAVNDPLSDSRLNVAGRCEGNVSLGGVG